MRLRSLCCLHRISRNLQQAASSQLSKEVGTPPVVDNKSTTERKAAGGPLNRVVNRVVTYYEECLGLSDVHKARNDVNQVL